MKLARRIAAVLLILAALLLIVRGAWTIGKGVDNAKEFFYGFIGKEAPPPPAEDSYSNEDGFITETKVIPVSGVETLSLEVNAAQVKLNVAGGSDIIVQAEYNEKNFIANNVFSAISANGTATVSLKQKNLEFSLGKTLRQSVLTITLPEKFKGSLNLDFNACAFDGDSGNASSITLSANAAKLELRGIAGSLTASVNACDSGFIVEESAVPITITASACAVKIQLPIQSNYKVSSTLNFGTLKNNYEKNVQRKGNETVINITGNAASFTVDAE
ncbi:MAG: hypothetical protein LBT21_06475 [Oscillospiraceae bacterium]|jgi:hypothetical protein|nr:hypothetical protein [Oscillospiraceae bacterium]